MHGGRATEGWGGHKDVARGDGTEQAHEERGGQDSTFHGAE